MMRSLLLLQFPFLFLPMFFIGLTNFDYNSDFKTPSSLVYLAGWLLFLWPFVLDKLLKFINIKVVLTTALVAQVILGMMIYEPLFMGFWDERSEYQAILLILMAWSSLTLSALSRFNFKTDHDLSLIAFLVIAAIWWLNYHYMMIVFLCLSFLALGTIFYQPNVKGAQMANQAVNVKLYMVLAAAHWAFMFIDYQVDPYFSILTVFLFLGVMLGALLSIYFELKIDWINRLGILNFIAVIFIDIWFLNALNILILGVWLGFLWVSFSRKNRALLFSALLFLGFFIGMTFYKNLAYNAYILVFMIPLIYSFTQQLRKQ